MRNRFLHLVIPGTLAMALWASPARAGFTEWADTLGGTGADQVLAGHATFDDGIVLAGSTDSSGAGGTDAWVVKYDSSGNIEWQNTYGGTGTDIARAIRQIPGIGFIVAGETNSIGAGAADFWVFKLNNDGTMAWQRTYGVAGNQQAFAVAATSDGGYIVTGVATNLGAGSDDVWVIKLDFFGAVTWEKTYGGSGADRGLAVAETTGGFVVTGWSASFGTGGVEMWVLNLDTSGNVLWERIHGGPATDQGTSVRQTADGGFVVAGWSASFSGGDADLWVVKLSSIGVVEWQKVYGGAGNDAGHSIVQEGSSYLVAGQFETAAGDLDAWLLRLDATGGVLDQKRYGGAGSDAALSVGLLSNGHIALTASTASFGAGDLDALTLRVDGTGSIDSSCALAANTAVTPANSTLSASATMSTVSASVTTLTIGAAGETTSTAIAARQCMGRNICGEIAGNIDTSLSPYVITCDLEVVGLTTLTLDPGVIFKFDPAAGPAISVLGTLVANGTAAEPIVFTSLYDDSVGGDTNGDGSATTPSPLDWIGIHFASGTGHQISHAEIAHSFSPFIFATGTGGSLTDTHFRNTRVPVELKVNAYPTLANLSSSNPDPAGNDGIQVGDAGTWTSSHTWANSGLPYIPLDSLTFDGSTVQTISPGAVFKFDAAGGTLNALGTLVANGTPSEPIVFTSLLDDSVVGDTNGDGSATSPSPLDWNGIFLPSGTTHQISNAVIAHSLTGVDFNTNTGGSLTDTHFRNTRVPVELKVNAYPTLTNLSSSNPDPAGNDGIQVIGSSGVTIWTSSHTWANSGLPYIPLNGLTFDGSTVQTISPGVVFKFDTVGGSLIALGTLVANGTPTEPIVFTSLLDDTVGGDTNGDGAATVPSPLDWGGILLGFGTAHQISNAVIAHSLTGVDFNTNTGGNLTDTHFRNTRVPVELKVNAYPTLANLSSSNPDPAGNDGIQVEGSTGVTVWTSSHTWANSGLPYIPLNGITFDGSTVQTIAPGVLFKFVPAGLALAALGTLVANGTVAEPIVFTSLLDDTVLGDTNGDGSATTPSSTDWGGIFLSFGTAHQITQAEIAHGLQGVTFISNTGGSLTDTHFRNTRVPVELNADAFPLLANLSTSAPDPLGTDGIVVAGPSTWTSAGTWTGAGIPYAPTGDLIFAAGAPLTLEAGVQLKMDGTSITMNDELTISGTIADPVVFTSIHDDTVGGDTGIDGPGTPAPGDWLGLELNGGVKNPMTNAQFAYARGGLSVNGVGANVVRGDFHLNLDGIVVGTGGTLRVVDSIFVGHDTGIDIAAGASADLGNLGDVPTGNDGRNNFACNTVHVRSAAAGTIPAEGNWWGEVPPPTAQIVGMVDTDPFLGAETEAVLPDLMLRLVNAGADVRLSWGDRAPVCGYRVTRSTVPIGPFTDISGALVTPFFEDPGAATGPPDTYFYLIEID